MLYVTTRSEAEPVTADHALLADCGDCGLYVPYKLTAFSAGEIDSLKEMSFGQAAAMALNRLFDTQLSGWDVEFSIGRHSVRTVSMSHRITIAEVWHNLEWDFSRMVKNLVTLITGNENAEPGDWAWIGVRTAALFGVYAEVCRREAEYDGAVVDIAVASGDFSAPMAAWYARKLGLPIANIIVSCNENCAPWDLISKGELKSGNATLATVTPECDHAVPRGLERLVYECGGREETAKFLDICRRGETYRPGELLWQRLREGVHVSVVGSKRVLSTIPNVHKTNSQVFGPYTALAYSGMLDYRTRTGESRQAIVISERSPVRDAETVAAAMGIGEEELDKLL